MIPEIGHYSLILALGIAILQASLPLMGVYYRKPSWIDFARSSALAQCIFIGISFFSLAYCLLINDFTVTYVVQNSNTHLPMIYRFCATWGAHEGSLLLWVFILSIWTAFVSRCSQSIPDEMRAQVLAILGMISIGFLLFLLITSNPFNRILFDIPIEGKDLNPLLQDPGLAIHPPILYIGYVGFSVAFAFAISALLSGRFDAKWAGWARPWTLVAWSFLTFGITLGSWWAYRVLGWGGWWFWDPVENASFLPWLMGTALIHSLIVAQKRDAFKAWTILLAICTFSLSLMGTFLVRSGILVSVHAFAIDPARGAFMLKFLAIVVGASLLLYAWKGHRIQNSGIFQFWSRETMLLSNNVLLMAAMLSVLLGTIYPLMIDAMGLGKLSVGPPYFNTVFVPLMIPLLFLMGFGPALMWQNSKIFLVISRFKYSLLGAIVFAIFIPILFTGKINFSVLLGLMLAFWIVIATLQNNFVKIEAFRYRSKNLGMCLAHIGFAICVIGIVISNAYSIQRDVRMTPNDVINVGPYRITFAGVLPLQGPNYVGYDGLMLLSRSNQNVSVLRPQLRVYSAQKMALARTAIAIKPFHDLYIALGEQLEKGAWSLRIYYKPFIRWIWLGGILMMLGGFLAIKKPSNRSASGYLGE